MKNTPSRKNSENSAYWTEKIMYEEVKRAINLTDLTKHLCQLRFQSISRHDVQNFTSLMGLLHS